MTIITYNVNGIRAAIRKGLFNWLKATNPDVLCVQETKAQLDQIPIEEFKAMGYFAFMHSAVKKGYSGVAIFCKTRPNFVEYGMGIEKYDFEGRLIRADFDDVSIISVYFPAGSSGNVRQTYKMEWLFDFQNYVDQLKKKKPNLVISGDYNICHEAIDIYDPIRNAGASGFLPEEREWLTKFNNSGFVDSFRFLNKESHHYTWWSYMANARTKNLGWRIDYNMVSESLSKKIKRAIILPGAKHSDHCPVFLELKT